jgi:hypothetical protein
LTAAGRRLALRARAACAEVLREFVLADLMRVLRDSSSTSR